MSKYSAHKFLLSVLRSELAHNIGYTCCQCSDARPPQPNALTLVNARSFIKFNSHSCQQEVKSRSPVGACCGANPVVRPAAPQPAKGEMKLSWALPAPALAFHITGKPRLDPSADFT